MRGVDANTGKKVEGYVPTMNEILEHEIGQHARDNVDGFQGTREEKEQRGMERENRYREKSGNPFRRDRYEMDWESK